MNIIIRATQNSRETLKQLVENKQSIDLFPNRRKKKDYNVSVTQAAEDSYDLSVANSDKVTQSRFVVAVIRLMRDNGLSLLQSDGHEPTQIMTFGLPNERSDRLILG